MSQNSLTYGTAGAIDLALRDENYSEVSMGANKRESATDVGVPVEATGAAERIRATADYERDTELEGIFAAGRDLLRRYPLQLLLGAALLGFIIGCGLSRLHY